MPTPVSSPAQPLSPKHLAPCPDSPNCVLSTAEDSVHRIDPFPLLGSVEQSLMRLASIIVEQPRTKITVRTPTYIHAEFTSRICRFTDDVEFLGDGPARVLHVRSASRIGYGDLGANRKRVEALRAAYLGSGKSG